MVWVTKASLYQQPCTNNPSVPAVNRAVMKQVLQRERFIRDCKMPEDACAANDKHIFKKTQLHKKCKKRERESPSGSTRAAYLTNQQMFRSCGFKSGEGGIYSVEYYQRLHTVWFSVN